MSDEFNGKISERVVREIIIWIDNNLGGDLSIDAIYASVFFLIAELCD